MSARQNDYDAILFDKDGTLFDFNASWGGWTVEFLARLADDPAHQRLLAEAILFDLDTRRFFPGSPVIAGTLEVWVDTILPLLPGADRAAMVAQIGRDSGNAEQVPVAPLDPLLANLRGRGLVLGLVTNDSEAAARAHLEQSGVAAHFDFVAGYDSGHGGKPDPGMLLAFAQASGIAPARTLMVGDSLHDLHAAKAAGMQGLGVLTGVAGTAELAPHAVDVLASIGDMLVWLDGSWR